MPELSSGSRLVPSLSLILIPTIAYGGFSILQMILGRIPGYHENALRKAFFWAGHTHAGVLTILALVVILTSSFSSLTLGFGLLRSH
jgi:hypothetical protein